MKLTVRVYVFLKNQNEEILLLDEKSGSHYFTKLPGGGLERGEGILECLKRELKEELNIENVALKQFYTSESFISSKLHEDTQVIAVYYHGAIENIEIHFNANETDLLDHHWIPQKELTSDHFTFPMDKDALEKFFAIH